MVRNLDAARRVFDENPHRGLGSWNAIISGLSRPGESKEALELVSKLRRCGVVPDDLTMATLMSACCDAAMLEIFAWWSSCTSACYNASARHSGRLDATTGGSAMKRRGLCSAVQHICC
jgi:pentatricopeptide repeat protein